MAIDFSKDVTTGTWTPRLAGIDVVVNTVGIFNEQGEHSFDVLHRQAPQALFAACVKTGVGRIIQVSALGADEHATTRFLASKKAADDFLLALPVSAVVIQPSLVFAEDGASSRLFARLALFPFLPLAKTQGKVQPIFIDDLVECITRLASAPHVRGHIAAVGATSISFRDYLQLLRARMGFSRAMVLPLPLSAVQLMVRAPGLRQIASADALVMLEQGNEADPAPLAEVLGHMPAGPHEFVTPMRAAHLRQDAAVHVGGYLLRVTIALMWIVTGGVSMGLYPIPDSLELLGRTGLSGPVASVALFGAAILDILIGIAVLTMRRRWVWTAQAALILAYTIIISTHLPEFWLHPYGPILKNLPLLAAIVLMRSLERR
jgi:uncharacterized protein YbjT (DUF2867 family)/uncharacterized membrane protein YphA (DoxX/SURF4 family)